jgi:signal transduction histidine kinase
VRLTRGTIDIESAPGDGTRIEFRLPAAEVEAGLPGHAAVA